MAIAQRARAAHAVARRRHDARARYLRGRHPRACEPQRVAVLNQQLRSDFQWATVMVEETPEGGVTWNGEETIEEHPWLQVWGPDGQLLFRNNVALAQPQVGMDLPNRPDDAIVRVPTARRCRCAS